jgi:hypothetical protein
MVYGRMYKEIKLSRREQLILLEISEDRIDTASSFVEYLREAYGFSKSSTWYCLNRLKEFGLVEFANKEEVGKPLSLTKRGLTELSGLEGSRSEIIAHFSSSFLENKQTLGMGRYTNGYLNKIYA